MAQRITLICDRCGKENAHQVHIRAVGGRSADYSADLCRACLAHIVKEAHARKGAPARGGRAPMVAVDYDTGEPIRQ